MRRVHLDATPVGDVFVTTSLCGVLNFDVTSVIGLVTCKVCLRAMLPVKTPRLAVVLPPVPRIIPIPLPLSVVVDGSRLTPERWAQQKCRCGRCDTCVWYKPLRAVAEGSDADELTAAERRERTSGREPLDRPRWPRAEAALEAYARHLENGHTLACLLGAVADAEEAGTWGVQLSRRLAESRAELAVEDFATLSLVLHAAHDRARTEGLDYIKWTFVLLARKVGEHSIERAKRGRPYARVELVSAESLAGLVGVPETAIASIVRSGLRCLRVEMAARNLISLWRVDSGLEGEIDRRRIELDARRRP